MAGEPTDPIDAARDQVTIGRALRVLRRLRGITQEELAVRVGTDATYLSQVENGHRGLRWHTVMRFLRALDADLHQLADAIAEVEKQ
jgi:transcriptional regulator with XRE-family HTH domain